MEASEPSVASLASLSFESVFTRRRIIASYWFVVLLAVPLWWTTTSIDRLSLPASRVRALDGRELHFPVVAQLSSHAGDQPLQAFRETIVQRIRNEDKLEEQNGISVYVDTLPSDVQSPEKPGIYRVSLNTDGGRVVEDRHLSVGLNEGHTHSLADSTDALFRLLAPYSWRLDSEAHRVVKYAPHYRLAFTLLNEDAASGQAALSWDVLTSISQYLQPTLDQLSDLHNFTIESQVQYHAPLAFQTHTTHAAGNEVHGLTPEHLTVFVNSAEWTLSSSVSNDPVIHFVLFIPSAQNSPLHILNPDGSLSPSNAFILPQWGGIVLLNKPSPHLSAADLHPSFAMFRHQLMALLGVPNLPSSVQPAKPESLTNWQLDALIRQRARENFEDSKETLQSIISLVNSIENMPVGQDVKGDVQGALTALDEARQFSYNSSTHALRRSSEALTLASRAFFNPGMLALLYFPAEHKYAVYTPLFASVAAPLVAAVFREFLAWRKSRKEQAEAKDTDSQAPQRQKFE